ncbi:MAG: HNH endonuclease [Gemmatimonadota bacterium]|nr:MAG: HNH endonuclease [Gemmatimonadota bacterium]
MGCLTLNASYEPLTIVPVQRALRLVIDRKAEALEVDESRPFRSERLVLPAPIVIRLVKYVHVPPRFRRHVTNTFLFARDHYTCQYCGRHRRELGHREFLTRDHLLPMCRGGDNTWDNVLTACTRCNHRKGNQTPEEAHMKPLGLAREPNHVELVWAVRKVTPVQAKYIAMFYGRDVLKALGADDYGLAARAEPN